MKKTIILFITIFLIILLVICVSFVQNQNNISVIKKENAMYEEYKNKEVFGTEVASLINSAVNSNKKNEVLQDEKGFFIENDTNSIKIELRLFYGEDLKTYQMETIHKAGTQGFVENFNLILFKCVKLEYHKQTKRVAKLVFEQIEQ